MDLVSQLVSALGVSEDQAKGGTGLLFQMAKDKLGGGEFAQIADAVPGMDSLLAAAPKAGGGGMLGALGGLASSLGGGASGLGNLAALAGGFDKLGLDAGMVGKFVPVVLDFVRQQGGDGVMKLLQGVLGRG